MTTYPPPGTYIRPVGKDYGFCLRVRSIIPPTKHRPSIWTSTRFGKTSAPDHQAVKDGHQSTDTMEGLQPTCIHGVWADRDRPWSLGPLYWREMNPERGQLEMFA